MGAGIWGCRHRPPAVAAAELSPTTTTSTSRRPKRTSAVAEADQRGGGGRRNQGWRAVSWAAEVLLVGRRRRSSWAVHVLFVGGGGPARGQADRRRRTCSWRRLAVATHGRRAAGRGDALAIGGGGRKETGFFFQSIQSTRAFLQNDHCTARAILISGRREYQSIFTKIR